MASCVISLAVPSVALIVRMAGFVVTLPAELLTVIVNEVPLSEIVVGRVV